MLKIFNTFFRKLKNREAAQTSRDKKKAYINDLEVTVKKLREQVIANVLMLHHKLVLKGRENVDLRICTPFLMMIYGCSLHLYLFNFNDRNLILKKQ